MTHGQFEAFLRARPSALFVEPIDVAQPSLPSGLGTTRPIITTTPDRRTRTDPASETMGWCADRRIPGYPLGLSYVRSVPLIRLALEPADAPFGCCLVNDAPAGLGDGTHRSGG